VTPDGRWVYFSRCRPDPLGGCGVFAARLSGPKLHLHAVVPFGPPHTDVFSVLFAISPNGKRLAWTQGNLHGVAQQVWVSRVDGSHRHPVSRPAAEMGVTSWLGNHRLVVDGPNAHPGARLFLLGASGGKPSLLVPTRFPHANFFGVASPSRTQIVFLSDDRIPDLAGNDIDVIGADGLGRHVLDLGTQTLGMVTWGTAPLLPAARTTPAGERTPALSDRQRRTAAQRIPASLRDRIGTLIR
jgi:hypothetical protein